MSTRTLTGVTLETLENCRIAATRAVAAYRLGGHRLIGVVDGVFENAVQPRAAKLAPRATQRMSRMRGNVTVLVNKGIDRVAERTEQMIDIGSAKAAAQVSKVAEFAAGIDNAMVVNGLNTAARLSLPGAKVALVVSGKVADGAGTLVQATGGRPVKKAVRKVAAGAKRAARAVKAEVKAVKPAAKAATKRVARPVAKRVAPAVKATRTRAAAKKVAAAPAA